MIEKSPPRQSVKRLMEKHKRLLRSNIAKSQNKVGSGLLILVSNGFSLIKRAEAMFLFYTASQ